MKTYQDYIDDATHAALTALGLSAENCPDLADLLNDAIASLARPYVTADESEEE